MNKVRSNTEQMKSSPYNDLLSSLVAAHPEDFINLVQMAMMQREDNEVLFTESEHFVSQFVVPGDKANNGPEFDRFFTVSIQWSEV